MRKFGIATAVHGRERQVEIFLAGIDRLRRAGYAEVVVAAAGDPEDPAMKLCADAGCLCVQAGNGYLSRKFQRSADALRDYGVDSISLFGSDDAICNGLFAWLLLGLEHGYEYLGVLDLYAYDLESGRLAYWPGYSTDPLPGNALRSGEPIGLARTYSRPLLARMGWQLWDADYPRGIDWPATSRVKKFAPRTLAVRAAGPHAFLVLDVKEGGRNLGPFKHYASGALPEEEARKLLHSRLSPEELRLLGVPR